MTHAALSPLIGPEFDEFLGASIGEDRNGTGLSVLSALARLDVDPWKEATSLARMPREAAAVRLTALIEALPNAPASAIPSGMSAADLVALLPKRKAADVRPSDSAFAATGLRETRVLMALSGFAIVMLVLFTMSALFSGWPGTGAKSSATRGARRRDGRAEQIETASGAAPPALNKWQAAMRSTWRATQPHSAGAISFNRCATRSTPGADASGRASPHTHGPVLVGIATRRPADIMASVSRIASFKPLV